MTIVDLPLVSFIDENPKIQINTEPENRPYVYIYDDTRKSLIFEGELWPDFSGNLVIDLVPEIKDAYIPVLPGASAVFQQNFIRLKFRAEDDDPDVYHYGTICLFSKDVQERMSDADELVVPDDYLLPISFTKRNSFEQAYIATRQGMINIKPLLIPSPGDTLGVASLIRPIKSLNILPGEKFRIVIFCGGHPVFSPYYNVSSQEMEQYLFYNRLGGWDNIAMSGRRTIAPTYEFGVGLKGGNRVQTSATVSKKYKQNSGGLTKQSASALAQLLESPAIYHLVDGLWQQIVIDTAELSIESDASIHSISFNYVYSEDTNKYRL